MNSHASKLGRRAKGKPKTLTKAERKRRSQRLAKARLKRWVLTPREKADGYLEQVFRLANAYAKATEEDGRKLKCYRFDVRPDGSTFAQAEFYPKP